MTSGEWQMATYDVLMLLVLVAAALWGYWKGFVWQLASIASIFSSYTLAYVLRVQVAKLIDAEPPWNMFAAMGIVYVLSSVVIWIGTGFASEALAAFKLKDFDRQLGATFGVAKGAIFCLLITFFAVSLLGEREQERICSSTSGRFMAKLLKSSGGLIPAEIHAKIDPFLIPLEQKLEQYQHVASEWPQQPYAPQAAQPQPVYHYGYPNQPSYPPPAYDPRYTAPAYAPPAYDPRYQPPSDPRYADPRGYAPPAYSDPRYAAPPPTYNPAPTYQNPRPSYASPPPPDPRTYWR
jgi:membrane protein required for colicin V production